MQPGKTIFKLFMFYYKAMTISDATALGRLYSVDEAVIRKCLTSRYLLDPQKCRLACYKILNNRADKVTGSK